MPELDPQQRSRENTLAVSLALIVSGMILFFLYIVSLGIVGNVLAGGLILVIVGSLHYLLWGHSLSREVAAEREALLRREAQATVAPRSTSAAIQALAPAAEPPREQPRPPSEGIQDLSHTKGITDPK